NGLQLRPISRHIDGLTVEHTREHNRLHAAQGSTATPGCVVQDLRRSLASLKRRMARLRREALALIQSDELLRNRFALMISIPGIAQISALQLLGSWLRCRRRCRCGSGWPIAASIRCTRSPAVRCIGLRESAAPGTGICAGRSPCLPGWRCNTTRI